MRVCSAHRCICTSPCYMPLNLSSICSKWYCVYCVLACASPAASRKCKDRSVGCTRGITGPQGKTLALQLLLALNCLSYGDRTTMQYYYLIKVAIFLPINQLCMKYIYTISSCIRCILVKIYTLVNISLHACQPVCIYRMYITGHGIHTEHREQCPWNVQQLAANWAAGIFRHVTRLMHICREVYNYTCPCRALSAQNVKEDTCAQRSHVPSPSDHSDYSRVPSLH